MKKPDKYDVTDSIAIEGNTHELNSLIQDAEEYQLPVEINEIDNMQSENDQVRSDQKREFPEFPEFQGYIPGNKLTKALKTLKRETHDTSDAPDEFIIPSFLAYWAGVVGNKLLGPCDLRPNVNIILFARSTDIRKSTSLKIAGTSFSRVQKQLDDEIVELQNEYDREHREWENLPREDRAATPEPQRPNARNLLLSTDFSDAGFFEMMANNPVSGIIVTGEYADYHVKLHRDFTGMSDAMLLTYDNERLSRQTRSYGLEVINQPTFSVLGATTFGNFRKVFSGTEKENGTLQRTLAAALTKPTKPRRSFLDRGKVDECYINRIIDQTNNWLNYPSELEVLTTDKFEELFTNWESNFIDSSNKDYGEEIIPHAERMVASCLKLTMLCDSLEIRNPAEMDSMELTAESLNCAIALIDELFLPSIGYLIGNEIITNRVQYNENLIEKSIKKAGGRINRSFLLRDTRLTARDLNEAIDNLREKEYLIVERGHTSRPQGGGNPTTIYIWLGN